ncbi:MULTISPECIES: helix-turn-helix domain-containing protein [Chryseobacterium]|uniref:Helix-turn-helix domain-containing protein n=1 Tax=Chryseobacterium endophyticum TaxID=1854762 RepID=A0AAU6WVQ5_9FLAO|nr:helix-turn-helix domain-containing protein [uncultured Chryseobacterium sp.]
MIRIKYPEKAGLCQKILNKKTLELMDIIRLNAIIAGSGCAENVSYNQKLKSYDKRAILQILDHQKKHRLNNSQLSRHFKLSRNTVAKWKKLFL